MKKNLTIAILVIVMLFIGCSDNSLENQNDQSSIDQEKKEVIHNDVDEVTAFLLELKRETQIEFDPIEDNEYFFHYVGDQPAEIKGKAKKMGIRETSAQKYYKMREFFESKGFTHGQEVENAGQNAAFTYQKDNFVCNILSGLLNPKEDEMTSIGLYCAVVEER